MIVASCAIEMVATLARRQIIPESEIAVDDAHCRLRSRNPHERGDKRNDEDEHGTGPREA